MDSDLWAPSASIEHLERRAQIFTTIRTFFAERDVLEVETPLLARFGVTDPHMDALTADNPVAGSERYYLQTSPEYAMKRLLAAGSGPIYQLCKAFRKGESGSRHNPEFSMLEWYRPGFDQFQLMDEVADLVASLLVVERCQKVSYRAIFQQYLNIDPHRVSCKVLQDIAHDNIDIQMQSDCIDDWLNILLTELIEPELALLPPTFIYDYPASQAALATVANDESGTDVAQRFELYVKGVELANGYFELTDCQEQKRRFEQDQKTRAAQNKESVESDLFLLNAMEQAGLPMCSGVALGVDRLVMLALDLNNVKDVLAFSVERA
jgi:elongation factor P--(R)-beta-lysine ligase